MVLLFLAEHHAEYDDEMVHIPLVRIAAWAIWRQYEKHERFFCLRQLQHVNDAVDVTLQRNANNGNPLALDDSDEAALRLLLSLALLRVMRVEAVSPDVFLRDAVDIVDRSPMTLSIEYELIVAKVSCWICSWTTSPAPVPFMMICCIFACHCGASPARRRGRRHICRP
ncbi:hypothetical protein C4B63_163g16 [Trypanosoma cruzi]|uniref:Uncharacterized protein n=1 Tax=Trypanosoma cruzi TaxID=5693 RepID=A0A2V2UQK4_TRYCR|nr:hypothetical protein C4B63_163g16 [Trypanosoma cruzi]